MSAQREGTPVSPTDLSQMSMFEMFRMEAETQAQSLTAGLLALESNPDALDQTEVCMRAAHSLKGAARIIGLGAGVKVGHAMEDCFVAVQKGVIKLRRRHTDVLLRGVDLLLRIAQTPEAESARWNGAGKAEVDAFVARLAEVSDDTGEPEEPVTSPVAEQRAADGAAQTRPFAAQVIAVPPGASPVIAVPPGIAEPGDRAVRVTSENLNRLLGLAGESLVESRWLTPFASSLLRLKRMQGDAARALDALRNALPAPALGESAQAAFADARKCIIDCQQVLAARLAELETYDRRSVDLAARLYDGALACRMRPFADGLHAWPRMVRDLGSTLEKKVRLKITGEAVQVDRDILETLDAPLGHLLRNAVDHGIESPAERRAAGKPEEGIVHLEARHHSGVLHIVVADDGRGVDLGRLRSSIVARGLTNAETAAQLSEGELLQFLFLPGFTTKDSVTEISGRGVGLDVVQEMVKQVRGTVRVSCEPGRGTRFELQLPLTLSVLRTMLVEINGEPYAFALAQLNRTLKVPLARIALLEGRQYFEFEGRQIGLVSAHQILEVEEPSLAGDVCVIVVGHDDRMYGLVVDCFLGERELVVQPLDPRLGKIRNVTAGALMENGVPVLIASVEDMIVSLEKLAASGSLNTMRESDAAIAAARPHKRVLVVDDSLTVRELERKLLSNKGYEVESAVDGMDAWHAVRTGSFDLVVTDVDMPRMDGIELVKLIKQHAALKSTPVMVISYKDREEDRRRGLDAGADYYLTKGSFHDETLLKAVVDLIGEA